MSANIDLVRSIFEDWGRGDFTSAEWAAPEIEYVHVDGPAPGIWTGLTGMRQAWAEVINAWEGFRLEPEGYRVLDDERVLVLSRWSGRGRESGLDLRQMRAEGAALFHIHGGRVTRLVGYFARERALADLGLKPDRPG